MKRQIETEKQAALILLDPYGVLQPLLFFFQAVTGWVSVTVEVFLRFDFGERYLSWLRLYFAYCLIVWFVFFNALANNLGGWVGTVIGLFVIASLVHRTMIFMRNRRQEKWHSYSPGVGWLEIALGWLHLSHSVIYRFLEPLLVLVLGFIFMAIDGVLGTWFVIAAFSLGIQRQLAYYTERNAILDVIDSQIESEQIASVLMEDRPVTETAGFTMMAVDKNMPVEEKKNLAVMFKGLDPVLLDAMDKEAVPA
ncbi:hypothetical protein KC799_16370 [candidate division KSB1 bacterium]|nr:hypothetical protein [candidate division KSB1 bacterium]